MITKTSYLDAMNKIKVRTEIFKSKPISVNTLVGLPGPDINDYIQLGKSYGIKRFQLYENDPIVMINQLAVLNHEVSYNYGNINNIFIPINNSHILYDLDYCCSLLTVSNSLIKFKDTNYIITLSIRPIKLEKIVGWFSDNMMSTIKSRQSIIYKTYRDTTPMVSFTNFI